MTNKISRNYLLEWFLILYRPLNLKRELWLQLSEKVKVETNTRVVHEKMFRRKRFARILGEKKIPLLISLTFLFMIMNMKSSFSRNVTNRGVHRGAPQEDFGGGDAPPPELFVL